MVSWWEIFLYLAMNEVGDVIDDKLPQRLQSNECQKIARTFFCRSSILCQALESLIWLSIRKFIHLHQPIYT